MLKLFYKRRAKIETVMQNEIFAEKRRLTND